jgi:drug/metabolite transporter (DMT)-like permease
MPHKKENTFIIFLAFLAIYLIWGTTYLAILFGLEGFPPFLLSALRFAVAGVILMVWCIIKKKKFPAGYDLKIAIISGIIMLVGGSGLVTWAEQYIASGYAAIIVATEPFLFLLLDKKRWPFYFSQGSIITGLILGFGGIVLFVVFAEKQPEQEVLFQLKLTGIIVLFISALLWVMGSLISKRRKDETVSNTATTSVQLIAAGLFSLLLSLTTNEITSFSFNNVSVKAWTGLLYLIIMGSVTAYLAFTWLLTIRPPSLVSTHTYVNPVVAVIMGWWIADETITMLQVLAMIVIIIGVVLTNKKVAG